ncbi:hypothetical protein SISSUDRAFT_1000066, partial [Sistotremastrum suecicum HHB10207 ss-3]
MDIARGWSWVEDELPAQHRLFHSTRLPFVPLTTLDARGRPWSSLVGASDGHLGFIKSPSEKELQMTLDIWDGDPIVDNIRSQSGEDILIAGLGIEFPTRRRNKFAGSVERYNWKDGKLKLLLEVNQALGNCPKYITVRQFEPRPNRHPTVQYKVLDLDPSSRLPEELCPFIHNRDGVFLGSVYIAPEKDASRFPSHAGMNHRAGRPGFVRVRKDGRTVVLPDYSGNRMMQSLGNIAITRLASMTFVDYDTGDILYLAGKATNLFGDEAHVIMPRSRMITVLEVTGYIFVKDVLPVRTKRGSNPEPSPYSPPILYLAEEKPPTDVNLDNLDILVSSIEVHTPDLATFHFIARRPFTIIPGQSAIIDLTPFVGKDTYRHMAHDGQEASLNDDHIRTWTISSAHSGPTSSFAITMREKPGGAITPKLLGIARAIQQQNPALLEDTKPLGLQVSLVGVQGDFVLPSIPGKLLFVAGGIGITPFLSMLSHLSSNPPASNGQSWDIFMIVSSREPEVMLDLIEKA